jgi:hypothetical protein
MMQKLNGKKWISLTGMAGMADLRINRVGIILIGRRTMLP